MSIVVSTPLDLPRLVPSSWELWWQIWEEHAAPLEKRAKTPNSNTGKHFGFDFIRHPLSMPAYAAKFVDLKTLDPLLYEQVVSIPLKIYCARFIMSRGDFLPHIDNQIPSWSVRNMFYCEDPNPQWYYTDLDNNNKQDLKLDGNTNWWAYLDGAVKHGTTFNENFPKIILQLFTNPTQTQEYVNTNIGRFPGQTHTYNLR